jgi:CRP-like cAMP-binding protein
MHTTFDSLDNPLTRKLESIFKITDSERRAISSLPMQVTTIKSDQDIVREGDRPSRCCLILSGFACTYKVTAEGKRQIVAFIIMGDIPDLHSLHLKQLDTSVGTISPCKVGFIPHEALWSLCKEHPRIAAAFWRETLVDASIFREWMLNVGRREAYQRAAHILCELITRLKAIGLAQDHSYELPITQGEFADALGLTTVHVNRVFQKLRADGIIVMKGTQLNIPDWEKLKEAGDCDSAYLHLELQME